MPEQRGQVDASHSKRNSTSSVVYFRELGVLRRFIRFSFQEAPVGRGAPVPHPHQEVHRRRFQAEAPHHHGVLAAVVTAVPFALLHGPAYQWSWQHLLLVFLAGCVFGVVRSVLDSTLAAAATHSAYNLTLLAGYIANG